MRGQRIGILTAGGDCPGINAAIRGVGKTAIVKYGMTLIGISDGFTGMINKEYRELTGMNPRAALRELTDLCTREVLVKQGTTGRSTVYLLKKN